MSIIGEFYEDEIEGLRKKIQEKEDYIKILEDRNKMLAEIAELQRDVIKNLKQYLGKTGNG